MTIRRALAMALAGLIVVGVLSVVALDRDEPAGEAGPARLVRAPATVDVVPVGRRGACLTVRYTPADAIGLDGDLCRPARPSRHGVLILIVHGGGGAIGDRDASEAWDRRYAADGYATFAIDYQRFDPQEAGPIYPRQESQVKAAVQWLRMHRDALQGDADRVVLHGISHGAGLAGTALVTPDDPTFSAPWTWPDESDRVDGLIGLYGYYDGYTFYPATYYGRSEDLRREASNLERAGQASGPALLVTGDDDLIVAPSQTVDFAAALSAAGVDVESVVVPGGGHGFDLPGGPALSPEGVDLATRINAWLDRHFGPAG